MSDCTSMADTTDYLAFERSLADATPPESLVPELRALWWARRDDWVRAHDTVQDLTSVASSRVHAYLHRVEGDLDNANYWYRRAGMPPSDAPLASEWESLTRELLTQASADSALR
jgi:hypothetical protein